MRVIKDSRELKETEDSKDDCNRGIDETEEFEESEDDC